MKPRIDGSVKSAMFTLVEGLIFIALGIAVNHSFLTDVDHDSSYPLGNMSLEILKIKNLFNNVSVAFFGFLVVASVLPPTAVRKNVPFFYAIYILVVMIIAVFMIAGIAVYTALFLNMKDYPTATLSTAGKRVFENRYSGTLAMLIVYAVSFFFHCIVTAYSIYHYFTWRVNLQRWTYDMEPSSMYYHHGMVNASYMHDRPPMDPRYFWPPGPPGDGPPGAFSPPPGYANPFVSPTRDEKPTTSSTQRSEASTTTEAPASPGPAHTEAPAASASQATGAEAYGGKDSPAASTGTQTVTTNDKADLLD